MNEFELLALAHEKARGLLSDEIKRVAIDPMFTIFHDNDLCMGFLHVGNTMYKYENHQELNELIDKLLAEQNND